MNSRESLTLGSPLDCLRDVSDRSWALLGLGQLDEGSCYIVDSSDPERASIAGYFDGSTGDVFECAAVLDSPSDIDRSEPAVHVIGSLDGTSGQVTVRHEQGNYLRICRWDRLDQNIASLQGATLRTLPQCGCGGSLGSPKLFESLAEMSAYHFCAFYLG